MDTKYLTVVVLYIVGCVSANSCQSYIQTIIKKLDSDVLQNQGNILQNQDELLNKINQISVSTTYWDQSNEKLRIKIEALETSFRKLDQETQSKLNRTRQDLIETEQKISQLESEINFWRNHGQGSVFVRWGRQDCPANTSQIVYPGLVGGSWYDHKGGASNYLCLPKVPQQLRNLPNSGYAFLYGGEYNHNEFGPVDGDDVPCAVCRSTLGVQTVMIPARVQCYDDWTRQYHGYLATTHYTAPDNSEYICMDEHSQARHGGRHNDNGALIHAVSYKCGSLPCPPYNDGDTATCVVCSL